MQGQQEVVRGLCLGKVLVTLEKMWGNELAVWETVMGREAVTKTIMRG